MLGAYCTSKYAVVGLTEALSQELAVEHPNVGITLFCPGNVRTDVVSSSRNRPVGLRGALRDGTPEDTGGPIGEIEPMMARQAGACAIDAVAGGRLYATTDPVFFQFVRARFEALESQLA